MWKNFKYFLITSCADIQLSYGNFLHQPGAFKKYVRHGGRRSIKSERKGTWGGSGEAIRSLCEKKLPDFTNNKQELSLISCLAVATSFVVLSLVQDITLFFNSKGIDIFLFFFSFNVFLWACNYYFYRT